MNNNGLLDKFSKEEILRVANKISRRKGLPVIEKIRVSDEVNALREITVWVSGVANQPVGLLCGTHSFKEIEFPDPVAPWLRDQLIKSIKILWDVLFEGMRVELETWESVPEK